MHSNPLLCIMHSAYVVFYRNIFNFRRREFLFFLFLVFCIRNSNTLYKLGLIRLNIMVAIEKRNLMLYAICTKIITLEKSVRIVNIKYNPLWSEWFCALYAHNKHHSILLLHLVSSSFCGRTKKKYVEEGKKQIRILESNPFHLILLRLFRSPRSQPLFFLHSNSFRKRYFMQAVILFIFIAIELNKTSKCTHTKLRWWSRELKHKQKKKY